MCVSTTLTSYATNGITGRFLDNKYIKTFIHSNIYEFIDTENFGSKELKIETIITAVFLC